MTIGILQTAKNQGTAVTSLVVTFGATPANGNFLIMAIATTSLNSTIAVSSITQTGTTWVQAISGAFGPPEVSIWYASTVSGAGTTATINLSAPFNVGAVGLEAVGLLSGSTRDGLASASGSNNSPNGGSVTANQDNELVITAIAHQPLPSGTITSWSNGFRSVDQTTGSTICDMAYLIINNKGNFITTGTYASPPVSNRWVGVTSTFKSPPFKSNFLMFFD